MAQTGLCPGCMRELGKAAAKTEEQKSGGQKMSAPGRHGQQGQRADTARCPYCGFCPSEYQQNPRCLPPDTILAGKYLVGKVLGEGGFGITYMGYDLNMKTRVAIKEYFPVELVTRDTTRRRAGGGGTAFGGSGSGNAAPGASASGGSVPSAGGVSSSGGGSDRVISLSGEKSETYQQGLKKYVDEARNVSQFADIPGIVSVKDFFYENNTAYIVMEYIEGISLKEYLKQKGGKLSEEESLAILRPVLEALEKVHAAGIVHRDISPDNIMLTFAEEGKTGAGQSGVSAVYGNISAVKLIDFGAARMTSKNDQKSLTIILKHGYAPEEQYRSHGEQGLWTDVYAICAVLYRMLTGKVPEPAMDRLFSDGLKRPEEVGAKVSPAVSEAIMRGLAVKKEDRIRSVRELMDALKDKKGLKITRKNRGTLIAVAGLIGICIALGLSIGFGNSGRDNEENNLSIHENDMAGLEEVYEPESIATIANPAEEELVLLEEDEEEEIAFRNPRTAIDSSRIANAGNNSVMLICMPDGSVRAIGDNSNGQCEVEGWNDVVAVSAGMTQSLGLDANGTVYAAGNNFRGECDVGTWKDIVAIEAGYYASFGLRADGTVVACGAVGSYLDEIEGWSNIRAIEATSYGLIALDRSNNIFYAGLEREDVFLSPDTGWEHKELLSVTGWEDVEYIYSKENDSQIMLVGIRKDGSVLCHSLTEETKQQENTSDFLKKLKELENWNNIQQLNLEEPYSGVKKDGTVICMENDGSDIDEDMYQEIKGWNDMEAVVSWMDGETVLGLTEGGQILECRKNRGNTELDNMTNLEWIYENNGSLIAGTKQGQLLTFGTDPYLLYFESLEKQNEEEKWVGVWGEKQGYMVLQAEDGSVYGMRGGSVFWEEENIKQVIELKGTPLTYALLSMDGNVHICSVDSDGRLTKSTGVHVEGKVGDGEITAADGWRDIQLLASTGYYLFGINKDGKMLTTWDSGLPFSAPDQKIRKLSGRDGTLVALTENGTIIFLDSNTDMEELGMKAAERWKEVKDFALGGSHIAGLLEDGTVVAAGINYAGQCDVEEWEDIVYVAVGKCCTVGITASGDLKIAGSLY